MQWQGADRLQQQLRSLAAWTLITGASPYLRGNILAGSLPFIPLPAILPIFPPLYPSTRRNFTSRSCNFAKLFKWLELKHPKPSKESLPPCNAFLGQRIKFDSLMVATCQHVGVRQSYVCGGTSCQVPHRSRGSCRDNVCAHYVRDAQRSYCLPTR